MNNYPTLNKYLLKLFISYFLLTSTVIIATLILSSSFDLLQKMRAVEIAPKVFWGLIFAKIPYLLNELSAIIGFLSVMIFLQRLTSKNEFIIILSSGVPIWRVFIVPLFMTFCFGILFVVVVSPLGSYGLRHYEKLEAKVTKRAASNVIVAPSGIFFFEEDKDLHRVVQAKSISPANKQLHDITVLLVNEQNQFVRRIDAPSANLDNGILQLNSPKIIEHDKVVDGEVLDLPTKLSVSALVKRFISPEAIPIWSLRPTINKLAKSGIPTTVYQIYYYKQIFKPIIMLAMACLACWFVSLNVRDNSGPKIMVTGLVFGVVAYFLLEIILRVLAYSGFNPMLAVLLPVLFLILISNFVILHFQEA